MQEELRGTCQGNNHLPSLATLERLPYLDAVVKETLRLGNLVPGRLPRLVPPGGMNIAETHIPGGTVVSSSTHLIHTCPSIFPDPAEFIPERWLPIGTKESLAGVKLDRYLLPFSTGSRDCIGNNLALAEIRSAIAGVVTFFDIRPANTQYSQQELSWRDNIVASYDFNVRIAIRKRI